MADKQFDVVVIGAGPGGYAAAFHAADLGLQVGLIDKEPLPGGTCLLRGCIPSKALLHAANVVSEAREMAEWGVTFGEPKIDVEALRKKKTEIVEKLAKGVKTLAGSRKVEYLQGQARFENSKLLLVSEADDRTTITFKHAIIATGSAPLIPASLQVDDPRVMDSTGGLDLPDVPKKLLVVGGGYIGMELGTVYQALGSAVTVVEGTDRLLGGADPDLVRPLLQRAKKNFAAIEFETFVDKLEPKKEGIEATLRTKDGNRAEVFDRVLVSVGRRPISQHLGLETTKVKVNNKGFIQVDEQMRTAEPNIFAIGDVTGEPLLAHKASYEGRVAAEVLAGQDSANEPQAIPAVVFTDPEIAWCGLTEAQAKEEGRSVKIARFPWGASGRATTLTRNDGVTKLVLDPDSGRVLGVGIAGVGAGELISEGVLAVEMGAVAEDIGKTIHPHPTLSETIMESADVFFGHATHVFTPKRG